MSANLPIPGGGRLSQIFGDDWRQFYNFLTQMEPVVTTKTLIGDAHNLDVGGAVIFRAALTGAGSFISGVASGTNGRQLTIANITPSLNLFILNDNSQSEPKNRFLMPDDPPSLTPIIVRGNGSVQFWYDGTVERWRLVGGTSIIPPP